MLEGLVPGLARAARAQDPRRAEGVPLYAVETVRMLLTAACWSRTVPATR